MAVKIKLGSIERIIEANSNGVDRLTELVTRLRKELGLMITINLIESKSADEVDNIISDMLKEYYNYFGKLNMSKIFKKEKDGDKKLKYTASDEDKLLFLAGMGIRAKMKENKAKDMGMSEDDIDKVIRTQLGYNKHPKQDINKQQ